MPSLHLRLLGAAQVSALGGLPMQVGSRTLALLAVAATGGPRGISREAAMGLFWPDSDPTRGRNSLRQRLFTLRRELNVEPLLQSPESLRLDPAVIAVDLWEFEAATVSNQPQIAASVYGGPFMDGFALSGVGGLDRWMERERSRLRGSAIRAMDRLAVEDARRGDHAGAVEWRRRLSAIDPLSSRIAADLVHALVAHKDRVGALQHARVHSELVKQELDTEPDPSFIALVQSLDLRKSPMPAPLRFEPHSDPAYRLSEAKSAMARDRAGEGDRVPAPDQLVPPRASGRLRSAWLAAAVLVLVGATLALSTVLRRTDSVPAMAAKPLVVVGSFVPQDSAVDPAFGRGVARLVTVALNETAELRAVDAGTRHEQPRWFLTGSIARTGDRVRIDASLIDLAGQRETPFSLQGPSNHTFQLVERLATQVAATQRARR